MTVRHAIAAILLRISAWLDHEPRFSSDVETTTVYVDPRR